MVPAECLCSQVELRYRSRSIATCGVVVRNSSGDVIFSANRSYDHVEDVVQAELLAIMLGLKLAADRGLKLEVVESDAFLAIREIGKGKASMSEWFGLLKDIHYFADKCEVISFHHFNRDLIL